VGTMLKRHMRSVLLIASLAASSPAFGQAGPAPDAPQQERDGAAAPPELLREIDAAYRERDTPGALQAMETTLEEAAQRWPGDYEVLWRLARHYFWLSDDPHLDKKEKSRLGRRAWEYGDRAAAADPERVEGWHYAAAGMGNYALGIGIISALRQGIEGKFKERLSRAEQIDARFENGAIQTAWGRFWYELPWPKYSARRSSRALGEALRMNPDNVRANVYVADLQEKEGDPAKARVALQRAVAHPPGRYDAPEERRWQEVARRRLTAQ
jgi:tetratricopeptide (TPR) repeat protein